MSEVLTQRQNELCTVKEKLANLRQQRDLVLENEELKNGGKGKKIEDAISYCETQMLSDREKLERKCKEANDILEQKLTVIEQKKRALADEFDRKRQKLEADFEARSALLELDSEKLRQKCDRERDDAESSSRSYQLYLEKTKVAKEESLVTVNNIKSAATLAHDKQIRELEKQEKFLSGIVDMCIAQLKRNNAPPEKPWVNPCPMPWDPEEAELAKQRADAKREVADRNKISMCPYSPSEMAYRSYA